MYGYKISCSKHRDSNMAWGFPFSCAQHAPIALATVHFQAAKMSSLISQSATCCSEVGWRGRASRRGLRLSLASLVSIDMVSEEIVH